MNTTTILILCAALVGCTSTYEAVPGPAGEQGEQGPRGVDGERGPPGPACVERDRERGEAEAASAPLAESDVGSIIKVSAMCPEDAVLVAGGCRWTGTSVYETGALEAFEARPVLELDGADRDGWICQAIALRVDAVVRAWAICEE